MPFVVCVNGTSLQKTNEFVNRISIDTIVAIKIALNENEISVSDLLDIIRILLRYILSKKWLTVKEKALFLRVFLTLFLIKILQFFVCLLERFWLLPRSPPANFVTLNSMNAFLLIYSFAGLSMIDISS